MALSREKRKLLDRLRSPRFRSREGSFLVEGVRGVREVLDPSLPLEVRFAILSPRLSRTPEGEAVAGALRAGGVAVEELEDGEMEELSDTETHQGVILVVREPADGLSRMAGASDPRILLLDGIQDPGNVGTLIRSARAFGITGVIALDGTADPWSPKVVRASAGAFAHVPVVRMGWEEASGWLEERALPVLAADAGGEDVAEVPASPAWALAVGNEGGGPRREVLAEARSVLSIPMAPGADSLNAGMAGTVLLYALTEGNRG